MSEPYPSPSWTPSYPPVMSPTIPVVPSNDEYTSYFPSPAEASVSAPLPPAAHEITDDSYVMYYFESVRKEQFVFAGNSLTNTLYSVRLLPRSHFHLPDPHPLAPPTDRPCRSKRPGRQCYLCSI